MFGGFLGIIQSVMKSDQELLASWQQGVKESGDILAVKYYSQLRRFFYDHLNPSADLGKDDFELDPHLVDELVQTTIATAFTDKFGLRFTASFKEHVFRLARINLAAYFRSQLELHHCSELDSLEGDQLGMENAFDRLDSLLDYWKTIHSLPRNHRLAIFTRLRGITCANAAKLLGISERAMKARSQRAFLAARLQFDAEK